MNSKKEIERHRLPCGAVTVGIEGNCRRKLRDQFDSLLDRLTQETHPEGIDEEIMEVDEVQIPAEETPEESPEAKKTRMIEEGKMKAEVKAEVDKYKEKLMGNSKMLQDISGKTKKR